MQHGHKQFFTDLATMRLTDDDRNGSIDKEREGLGPGWLLVYIRKGDPQKGARR